MLLKVHDVVKKYRQPGRWGFQTQTILNGVSFQMQAGQSVGLVGRSGSGKSTLARVICGLEAPDSGQVLFKNKPVQHARDLRSKISLVFQDYTSSINPTMTVFDAIAEPLSLFDPLPKPLQREQVAGFLQRVGLSPDLMGRYLGEMSGGQAQRVCLSRALVTYPDLLVLDEAVSSLDVSTQVQILDLLEDLQREFSLSYLFITHDVRVMCYLCQQVLFFDEQKIVEDCAIEELPNVQSSFAQHLLQCVL